MAVDIYSYCNYKESSVGFQIGQVELKSGRIYRSDSIPQYIIKCFESSLINKGYGKYPGKKNTKYFYLIKGIDYLGHDPEPDKYINIAFECSDALTYIRIKRYFKSKTPEQISQLFGKMVLIDVSNSEYEMRFDVDQLSRLIQQFNNEEVDEADAKKRDYYLIISSYESKTKELLDLFELKKYGYVLCNGMPEQKGYQYRYRFVKKNSWILLLTIIIVIIILLAFFLLLRK